MVYLKFNFNFSGHPVSYLAMLIRGPFWYHCPSLQKPLCEFGMFLSGVKQVAEKAGG